MDAILKRLALIEARLNKLEGIKAVKKPKIDLKPLFGVLNECHKRRYGCTLEITPYVVTMLKAVKSKAGSLAEHVLVYYYVYIDSFQVAQSKHDLKYCNWNCQAYLTAIKTDEELRKELNLE